MFVYTVGYGKVRQIAVHCRCYGERISSPFGMRLEAYGISNPLGCFPGKGHGGLTRGLACLGLRGTENRLGCGVWWQPPLPAGSLGSKMTTSAQVESSGVEEGRVHLVNRGMSVPRGASRICALRPLPDR